MISVFRVSSITGVAHTMLLDVTQAQLDEFRAGGKVHKVFPHLNMSQREFILSGITPEEWEEFIGTDDDKDD